MTDTASDSSRTTDSATPPIDRVRHEMERWIEAARTTGERALETLGLVGTGRPTLPSIDVIELPSEVVVLIDLPGVAAETVDLSLVGNMLTVRANRCVTPYLAAEGARAIIVERVGSSFDRSIPLPVAVNPDAIRAETRDGLLTVSLMKASAPVTRPIPVSRGNGGQSSQS